MGENYVHFERNRPHREPSDEKDVRLFELVSIRSDKALAKERVSGFDVSANFQSKQHKETLRC